MMALLSLEIFEEENALDKKDDACHEEELLSEKILLWLDSLLLVKDVLDEVEKTSLTVIFEQDVIKIELDTIIEYSTFQKVFITISPPALFYAQNVNRMIIIIYIIKNRRRNRTHHTRSATTYT